MSDRAGGVSILFVHHGLDWITGSERCLLDLMAGLDRERYAPILLCNAGALAGAAAALGVPVYRSEGLATCAESLWPERSLVDAVAEIVEKHDVRLIHANDFDPVKALLPTARRARIPLLAHLHIVPTADERRWSLLHQVSLAVGVSHGAIRGLLADGFPAARAVVVYNGVDPERLGRGDQRGLRCALGIDVHDTVFTVVGSLIPRKGTGVVLRAFALVCRRRGDCRMLVCGDGALDAELRALASDEGIAGQVHFLGRRDDVGAVLRDATDVLVSASFEESFGLTLAEAGVFGLPTITTAIDAHVEVSGGGRSSLHFAPGDVLALATAMETLAADPARRRELGAAGRRRVEAEFLIDRYVARFEEIYAALLARPRASNGWMRSSRWPVVYWKWIAEAMHRRVRRSRGVSATPARHEPEFHAPTDG